MTKLLIILLLSIPPFLQQTLAAPENFTQQGSLNSDARTKISHGKSICPILGYDPTFGFLLGGAFFNGNTESAWVNQFDALFYGAFKAGLGLELKLKLWDTERLVYYIESGGNSLFDSYFGEGQTDLKNQKKIDNLKLYLNPSAWYRITKSLSTGLLLKLRSRNEFGVNGDRSQRVFGSEFTPLLGVAIRSDTRNHEIAPKTGNYAELRADYGPSLDFSRLQFEDRKYLELTPAWVFVLQAKAGASFGEPGYLYRYSLGGENILRGYQANRLRGRYFYLFQAENRYSLLRWLSVNLFSGLGDVGDKNLSDFSVPRITGGFGLRVGLPPDNVAKVRIDLGFARDEVSFYLNFNEAF